VARVPLRRTREAKLKASVEDGICRIRHNAAATISATPQIASASHIVVTFNYRFCAHYGLKSDIAPCPKRARNGHPPAKEAAK
jgi:hypothetical protein